MCASPSRTPAHTNRAKRRSGEGGGKWRERSKHGRSPRGMMRRARRHQSRAPLLLCLVATLVVALALAAFVLDVFQGAVMMLLAYGAAPLPPAAASSSPSDGQPSPASSSYYTHKVLEALATAVPMPRAGPPCVACERCARRRFGRDLAVFFFFFPRVSFFSKSSTLSSSPSHAASSSPLPLHPRAPHHSRVTRTAHAPMTI